MAAELDVFLSHNSRDKDLVREIDGKLAARGLKPWLDERDLRPGLDWQDGLAEGVHACRSMVVFIGAEGTGAWQRQEVKMALNLAATTPFPVIPVLLPGAPEDVSGPKHMPSFLPLRTWVDLRPGVTEEGLDRLVWGITGERPDPPDSPAAVGRTPRGPSPDLRAPGRPACHETPRWNLWRPMPEEPIAFHLLDWRVRLSVLQGRNPELEDLVAWAEEGGAALRCRVVSGPGGVGKSRFAAELCDQLGRRGWEARFWDPHEQTLPAADGAVRGLLFVFDYPEERQRDLYQVLRSCAARSAKTPDTIRVLLLSRRGADWWRDRLDEEHLGHLLDSQGTVLSSLSESDALAMFHDISSRVADRYGVKPPAVDERDVAAWRKQDPRAHSRPLILAAMAIHATLAGSEGLRLHGGAVLRRLAQRERNRLDKEGAYVEGLACPLSRLAGLAAVAGRLGLPQLEALAAADPALGLPRASDVPRLFRRLHLWQDGHLAAPRPDVLAVALLLEVLEGGGHHPARWLWAVLQSEAEAGRVDLLDRLGRLVFDAGQVDPRGADRLRRLLVAMVEGSPERAVALEAVAAEYRPPDAVLPLTIAVHRKLAEARDAEKRLRARRQQNLARHLVWAGEERAALEPDERSITTFRCLLLQEEDAALSTSLAESLRILASIRLAMNQPAKAVAASREEVEIRRRLLDDDESRRELAGTLNNLSMQLRNLDQIEASLAASREAAEIARELASRPRPPQQRRVYEDSLGRVLHHLAISLWLAGSAEEALAAARESVDIRRPLADAEPHRYTEPLVWSLQDHANLLAESGEQVAALAALREVVALQRELFRANPVPHGEKLIRSLDRAAAVAGQAGWMEEATAFTVERIEILSLLLDRGAVSAEEADPVSLARELASLGNAATGLGAPASALRACDEAIAILDRTHRRDPSWWSAQARLTLIAALLNRGNARHHLGDAPGAIEDYGEALRQTEHHAESYGSDPAHEAVAVLALLNRAKEHLDLGDTDSGLGDFDAAMEKAGRLRDGLPDAAIPQTSSWRQTLRSLAPRLLELGDFERSGRATLLELALEATEAVADDAANGLAFARVLVRLGCSSHELGDRDRALLYLWPGLVLGCRATRAVDGGPDPLPTGSRDVLWADLAYGYVLLADITGEVELLDRAEDCLRQVASNPRPSEPSFFHHALQDTEGLLGVVRGELTSDPDLLRTGRHRLQRAREGMLELEDEKAAAVIESHLRRAQNSIARLRGDLPDDERQSDDLDKLEAP